MKEKLIAIVDLGTSKQFFVVPFSDVNSFLQHHSFKNLRRSVTIVFQSALEYDPDVFQSQFDSLRESESKFKDMFNSSSN